MRGLLYLLVLVFVCCVAACAGGGDGDGTGAGCGAGAGAGICYGIFFKLGLRLINWTLICVVVQVEVLVLASGFLPPQFTRVYMTVELFLQGGTSFVLQDGYTLARA